MGETAPAQYKQGSVTITPQERFYIGKDFTHKGHTYSLDDTTDFSVVFEPTIKDGKDENDKDVKKINLHLIFTIQSGVVSYTLEKSFDAQPNQKIVALGTTNQKYDPYLKLQYEEPAYNLTEDKLHNTEFRRDYLTALGRMSGKYNHAKAFNDEDTINGYQHEYPDETNPPVILKPENQKIPFFTGPIEFEGNHWIHYYRWERFESWYKFWKEKVYYLYNVTETRVSVNFPVGSDFTVPYVYLDKEAVTEYHYSETAEQANSFYFDLTQSETPQNDAEADNKTEGNAGTDSAEGNAGTGSGSNN